MALSLPDVGFVLDLDTVLDLFIDSVNIEQPDHFIIFDKQAFIAVIAKHCGGD